MVKRRGEAPRETIRGADGRRSDANLGALASRLAAQWIADDPDERYRRIDGSMVSADLSGFTAMSERLASRGKEGSERLTATVNSCFTALIASAEREGGDVLKFGGDAILLWFDGAGHAQRAARAGARMQRSINAPRFSRAGLTMTVGAHSGTFDFFLVGQPNWRELVVAGRAASITVDLEAAAPSGQVLVSEAMADALPTDWRGRCEAGGVVLDRDAIAFPRRPTTAPLAVEVPQLVAPTLRADVEALASWSGEHRLATIVFAELHGTDNSVDMAGADFVDSVDALVQAAQDASERYHVQFLYTDVIADGIKLICTAGAPTASGHDEEAALRFATDLVHNDPKQRLRAGVHAGRVFAGFLGSPDRRTYTVMGDPVNLSARLMGKAEPGQVVATADLMRRCRAVFETVELAPFLVKGKSAPIEAVVVGAPTGESRSRALDDVPLVGRDEEVAQLRQAIATAVGGAGQVVEIVGDAGIGKTRLLQAVADDPRFLARVATECQPYDTLSPYASVRPLLRGALSIAADASAAQAGTALVATVARVAPDLMPLVPLLAVPIGADVAPTVEADAVAEEFRAERTHRITVDLLAAVLTVPTMLVVEDVYYVDDASLRLLQALAGAVPDHPWLLALTRRPEGPGLVVGAVTGALIKLQPLDGAVAARLAEAAAGDRRISSIDLEAMARRSGGNPLFMLKLVDATGDGVDLGELPESIERLVATRVDRLDPVDRALVRQAAVIGRVFNADVLDALLAHYGDAPVDAERWIELSELVEPEGPRTWRFRHALFRDVAYEGLPFARRKRMHRVVGEVLEAGVAGEPDVALLSQHFWLAGDAERTWRYSVAAGDAAWANFAVAEAIAAYRRALGVRRRLSDVDPVAISTVAEALGDVLERAARYDESDDAYRVASSICRAGGLSVSKARLLRKVGILRERRGELDRAARAYLSARRLLERGSAGDESEELAKVELSLASTRHRQGRHSEMVDLAQSALRLGEEAGSDAICGLALNLLQVGVSHGVGVPTTRFGTRALERFEAVGDVRHQGLALLNIGVEQQLRGSWSAAVTTYNRSADAFLRAGDGVFEGIVRNNRAELLCDQGYYDNAEAEFAKVRRTWQAAGYGIGLGVISMNVGRLVALRGELAAGLALLEDAYTRFEDLGSASYAWEVKRRIAEVHLLAGRPDAAITAVGDCDSPSVEAFGYTVSGMLRVRGWASVQNGHFVAGRRCFEQALTSARSDRAPFDEALALVGLALIDDCESIDSSVSRGEAEHLLAKLGVVHVPSVPVPDEPWSG